MSEPASGPKGGFLATQNLGDGSTADFHLKKEKGPKGNNIQTTTETIQDPQGNVLFNGSTRRTLDAKGKVLQEETVRSDGRKQAIQYPKPHQSVVQHRIVSWEKPSTYSLALGGEYGRRDLANETPLAHHAFGGRLAFGLRLNGGRQLQHVIMPRIFYDFNFLHRNVAANIIKSQAQLHTVGLEGNYLFEAVGNWLWVGGALGLGVTFSRSKDDPTSFVEGVLYNDKFSGSSQLRPLNETAFRLEVGPKFCTWGLRVCLDGKYSNDLALDPKVGEDTQEGLNAPGFSLGLSFDILQFFNKPTPKGYLASHQKKKR